MDVGEKFFKWLYTGSQERKNRHFVKLVALDLLGSGRFERLELVCRAFNNSTVRLHLSDALDFPDQGSLFLPRKLGLAQNEEQNFLVYLYRVMTFHGALHETLESGQPITRVFASNTDALLQSALASPALHRTLVDRYGGFADLLAEVRGVASDAAAHFSKFDSNFSVWAKLVERALSLEDFILSDDETASLVKNWRKDWIGSSYCPLLALSILPQAHRRTKEGGGPGEDEALASRNALPRASSANKQEVQIKTVARPEIKNLSGKDENPLSHVFEKLLTAEEHQGGSKTQDGTDESEDHADALSELTLDSVARTQTGSDSILKADAQIDSFAPDLAAPLATNLEVIHHYPEWFHETRSYKPDFCKVYESVLPTSTEVPVSEVQGAHSGLSEKLSSFLNESRWKPRQKDGAEFDLDAIVRWRSQLHGEGPIDQRLYMGRRRLERNLAILILLDSSLSTDAWVGNQRVLDVMRRSVAIIGDAFAGLDDRFAIASFNSYSRHRCDFKWVKEFQDTWSVGRVRLNGIKPDGYTRIGPALRHARVVLDKVKARRKLIILFSDAKPSDYDRYEGVHGLSDVHKAVTEIKSQGIVMKGIAVAQEHRGNLTSMFGAGQYIVLSDPMQIGNKVLQIFTEMMARS